MIRLHKKMFARLNHLRINSKRKAILKRLKYWKKQLNDCWALSSMEHSSQRSRRPSWLSCRRTLLKHRAMVGNFLPSGWQTLFLILFSLFNLSHLVLIFLVPFSSRVDTRLNFFTKSSSFYAIFLHFQLILKKKKHVETRKKFSQVIARKKHFFVLLAILSVIYLIKWFLPQSSLVVLFSQTVSADCAVLKSLFRPLLAFLKAKTNGTMLCLRFKPWLNLFDHSFWVLQDCGRRVFDVSDEKILAQAGCLGLHVKNISCAAFSFESWERKFPCENLAATCASSQLEKLASEFMLFLATETRSL